MIKLQPDSLCTIFCGTDGELNETKRVILESIQSIWVCCKVSWWPQTRPSQLSIHLSYGRDEDLQLLKNGVATIPKPNCMKLNIMSAQSGCFSLGENSLTKRSIIDRAPREAWACPSCQINYAAPVVKVSTLYRPPYWWVGFNITYHVQVDKEIWDECCCWSTPIP